MNEPTFIQQQTTLLNSLGPCSGDKAKLAHALSTALDRLQGVVDQANAQFKVGDRHATFNRQTIEKLNEPFNVEYLDF